MTLETVVSWLICGLIVGLIARLLVPGRQPIGLLMTIVLGIVGAIVGGYLYSFFMGPPADPLSTSAWRGWIVSILGAVVVLLVFQALYTRRRWP